MESIHKRIKRLREAKKATQDQLATAAGVSYQSVQEWEREDGTAPSRKRQSAVAKFLGVSVPELLTGEKASSLNSSGELAPKEEILLHLFRGLFNLQQKETIVHIRALFDANQITRKELGTNQLRGVSNEEVEKAFGAVPAPHKHRHTKKKAHREPGDAMGDFIDDD